MTETLISPRALEILRLITPEWQWLRNREMQAIPEMRELELHGLIEYKWAQTGHYVKLNPLSSQFVPEHFN